MWLIVVLVSSTVTTLSFARRSIETPSANRLFAVAVILMATKLATVYLGNAWLPLVAVVSGLSDADAIAFSLSTLQRAGLVSVDWASFNLVLGALSNTFMKLFLVFGLGHRGLFKQLLVSFLVIGTVGLVTMFLYYDLGSALPAT